MRCLPGFALLLGGLLTGALALPPRWFASPPPARAREGPAGCADPSFLVGEVRDASGPVAGARVHFQGVPSPSTLTDAHGRFRLPRNANGPRRMTAWKEGYRIAGAAAGTAPLTLLLTPLPKEDCERYTWVDPTPDPARPQNCGNCHTAIYQEWAASGHARAADGRRFRNLYAGTDWQGRRTVGWNLLAEQPDGAGVCTACHAPTIRFDDPAYYDLRAGRGPAARGVSCDYCHKVSDVAGGEVGRTHGRFGLKLLRPAEGQLFFGPLDDVDRGEDAYSPLYHQSRYCAACHEGTVFGVPVYSTYSEWLESPARQQGKQCQTCHMAATGTLGNLAPGKGGIPRDPQTLANHRFFAGSQEDMLRRCLRLSVYLTPEADGVRADVAVRADPVGHRVPTGFADRNLVLVVEAFRKDGSRAAVAAGTPVLPRLAGPSLAGAAGQLYAKQLRDAAGRRPVPFWRAEPEFVDTRLAPGRVERSGYRFAGPVERLRVRLLYRRFWEEVAQTKGWPKEEILVADQTVPVRPPQRGTGAHPR